jgi:hypothetical protein
MDYFGGRQEKEEKVKQDFGPLSPKALFELFLLSTSFFAVSALLIQLLMSLQLSFMLNYLSIEYVYHPLGVGYTFVSELKWNDARIFGVYGIAPLLFFALGMALTRLLLKLQDLAWKWRLFLTWLAFLLVHTLPVGLIAGVFIYDGYGYAFRWLVDNLPVRAAIGIAIIGLVRYYRFFWLSMFLKSAYDIRLIGEFTTRKVFIVNTVYRPWFIGALALTPFVMAVQSIYWGVWIVLLGVVFLPLFGKDFPDSKLKITMSTSKLWPIKYPIIYVTAIWLALWISLMLLF